MEIQRLKKITSLLRGLYIEKVRRIDFGNAEIGFFFLSLKKDIFVWNRRIYFPLRAALRNNSLNLNRADVSSRIFMRGDGQFRVGRIR